MIVQELIDKLKKFNKYSEVMLLDHRCLEAFPTELSVVRKIRKRESEDVFEDDAVIID